MIKKLIKSYFNLKHSQLLFNPKLSKANNTGKTNIRCNFCTKNNSHLQQTEKKSFDKDVIEHEKLQENNLSLMKKTYQEIEVESFKGKFFSNLTQLQRKIIQQGKFDLEHPEIKPKLASIDSVPGLQNMNQITEIELGNIRIKQKNEVFLSEVDPYNIPMDYKIRFDEEKKLTIMGKRVEKGVFPQQNGLQKNGLQKASSSQMSISYQQSFEQKTVGQFSKKYMGQIGYKYQFNRKQSFRQCLLALPFVALIIQPIISTLAEIHSTLQSIHDIENQQLKEIQHIKQKATIAALINNQDFNEIL